MTRAGLTEKLLDIKREKGWTWKYICDQIGGMSPVMITGGVLGQHLVEFNDDLVLDGHVVPPHD